MHYPTKRDTSQPTCHARVIHLNNNEQKGDLNDELKIGLTILPLKSLTFVFVSYSRPLINHLRLINYLRFFYFFVPIEPWSGFQ